MYLAYLYLVLILFTIVVPDTRQPSTRDTVADVWGLSAYRVPYRLEGTLTRYDVRYAYRSEGLPSVRYVSYRKSEYRIDDTVPRPESLER